ncbi:MAG: hypothetical protein K2G70_03605, partial [Turicibacter sp.]|nr:hypothetical protein [Turicibacter sp.]
MENEDLPKLIDEYCKSLFNDSEDSDMLYEQVKAQFDELNQKYPMLKGILDNNFNNIGTDIEAAKQKAKSSTPSLFDDLTSIKEKMDTLTSSTSSL